MDQAWSWILTGCGVTAMILTGMHLKIGWIVGILGQTLWVAYALWTKQYGFLAGAFAFGSVYAYNWLRWHRKDKRGQGGSGPEVGEGTGGGVHVLLAPGVRVGQRDGRVG